MARGLQRGLRLAEPIANHCPSSSAVSSFLFNAACKTANTFLGISSLMIDGLRLLRGAVTALGISQGGYFQQAGQQRRQSLRLSTLQPSVTHRLNHFLAPSLKHLANKLCLLSSSETPVSASSSPCNTLKYCFILGWGAGEHTLQSHSSGHC